MTLMTTQRQIDYTGDGSTTTFTVPFKFFDASHLVVTLDGVSQSVFSTTGVGSEYGGTVILPEAPAEDVIVHIERVVPYLQPLDLIPQGPFRAEAMEDSLDRIVMMIQQLLDAGNLINILNANLIYDLATYYAYVPIASQILGRWDVARRIYFAENYPGSYAKSNVAATAQYVVGVLHNGTQRGSITFGAGASTGSFSGNTFTAYPGDIVSLVGSNTPDATIKEISITLAGVRIP